MTPWRDDDVDAGLARCDYCHVDDVPCVIDKSGRFCCVPCEEEMGHAAKPDGGAD